LCNLIHLRNMMLIFYSKLLTEQTRALQDLQRQLDQAQKAAQAEKARITEDHQRQLDHVQKTAEANAERTRRRTEAEISDLQTNVSKLEADVEKVLRLNLLLM
jgi:hypothetical protein